MKLIENWRDAWKFLSVQAAALLTVLLTLQQAAAMFEGVSAFESFVTHPYYKAFTAILAVAIILLRLCKQPALEPPTLTIPPIIRSTPP